jgi:deazaflavin-dependent oxidoreductase (nitroreductase family)
MLLLTARGRKSRLPRYTMLSYTCHAGKAYLLSGWGQRTDWYQNASADPHVSVQFGRVPYYAIARRIVDVEEYAAVMQIILRTGGDSHFRPWLKSLDIAYDLNDLIAKRDRVYLVALDPTDQVGPPPMASDLVWVWAVILAVLVVIWLLGRLLPSAR